MKKWNGAVALLSALVVVGGGVAVGCQITRGDVRTADDGTNDDGGMPERMAQEDADAGDPGALAGGEDDGEGADGGTPGVLAEGDDGDDAGTVVENDDDAGMPRRLLAQIDDDDPDGGMPDQPEPGPDDNAPDGNEPDGNNPDGNEPDGNPNPPPPPGTEPEDPFQDPSQPIDPTEPLENEPIENEPIETPTRSAVR